MTDTFGVTLASTTVPPDRLIVTMTGDIDHETATDVHDDTLALLCEQTRHVVIDLSAVGFCDSSGMSALVGIWRRLTAHDGTLTIAAAPRNIDRALTIGGLNELIRMYPTVEDAMQSLPNTH